MTPDRDDGCADDPAKTTPGVCGCGISDADTDGDGVAFCSDQCPSDPLKLMPGTCGCGQLESTSNQDGDGLPDCIDACPTDSQKTEPMQCGCGVAETDSDGDMISDCVDQCSTDPAKGAPGACGCGVPESSCVLCASANEGTSVSLSCPNGGTIQGIQFASYGTPSGSCPGGFSASACDASSSLTTVQAACVGMPSCSVAATNAVFDDPCVGVPKLLAITYTCSGGT
jgi:Galactose binding lectin domain